MTLLTGAAITQTTVAAALPATSSTHYIVRTTSERVAGPTADALSRSGVTITDRYTRVLDGFAAYLTDRDLRRLRSDPNIASVTPDVRISTGDVATPDRHAQALSASGVQTGAVWGLDRIDQHGATRNGRYDYDTDGRGVTAIVIDTGVRADHTELTGRVNRGYDFVDADSTAQDCNGHGTHVAGTIAGTRYGVAKAATITPLRVLNCDGQGWGGDLVSALEWVVDHKPKGPAVVNLSVGGPATDFIDDAVNATVAAGVPVVVAAGNSSMDACESSPARAASAITVAASDADDTSAWFTNVGDCVDLYAPGVSVRSAWFSSRTATAVLDGTSMATPHVSGAVARLLQGRTLTPTQTATEVMANATRDAIDGVDETGTANLLLFTPRTTPASPSGVRASRDDKHRSVTLSWGAPSSAGKSRITAYRVTRTGGATVNLPATARSYAFKALRPGGRYTVTVRAVNASGAGSVAGVTVTMTAPPGAPRVTKPTHGSTKDHTVSITARWSKPTSGGAVKTYVVRAKNTSTGAVTTVTRGSTARSAKVTGLKKKARYTVTVTAANDAGSSRRSATSARATAR